MNRNATNITTYNKAEILSFAGLLSESIEHKAVDQHTLAHIRLQTIMGMMDLIDYADTLNTIKTKFMQALSNEIVGMTTKSIKIPKKNMMEFIHQEAT